MRINTNLSARTAFNSLNATNKSLRKSIAQLSTGLRINSSADDAAGFAVSERMRAQISGLDAALRNSQDGISLLQTAEGALGETNSMLQRMRELAVQASNDSLTSQDRQYLQLEIDELRDQIDRIAGTTQFGRKRLLDGSCGAVWSSNDDGLKAKIHGGLEYMNSDGQKVSSEGNYRIEITSEPGQCQVQKSSIINIAREEITTTKEVITTSDTSQVITGYTAEPYEINLNSGVDSLGEVSGEGWELKNGTLTITGNGTYKITGNKTPTTNNIVVNSGVNAKVILKDVNINASAKANVVDNKSYCAMYMTGATVDLYLEGENTMRSGAHFSGIEATGNSTLTISSASGDYSSDGKLTVIGAPHSAGIGGSCNGQRNAGSITIKGGTIDARGGEGAAGIGGGNYGGAAGGTVNLVSIEGGTVTATGGVGGAGIGTGANPVSLSSPKNSSNIIIKGGTVTAKGGASSSYFNEGAAIGGGGGFNSGNITIDNSNASITLMGGYTDSTTQTESIGYGEGGDDGSPEARNVNYESLSLDAARELPELPTYDAPVYKDVTKTTDITTITDSSTTTTVSTLSDVRGMYNSSGAFILSRPQTITITQGDGKTASVTLYETDTMHDVAAKINDAIADTLGQGQYVDDPDKFCTISDGTEGTSESVYDKDMYNIETSEEALELPPDSDALSGKVITETKYYDVNATMLIRSAIPGKDGELYFSGDQDLLNALGLNTIQESSESTLTASVYDAHSGKAIVSNAKASGPEFVSLIPPEIDIEVDPMSGLTANWDESTKRFIMARKDVYTAYLHLKNTGTIFQTGANGGEDFSIDLGDASSSTLNLSRVNLLTRETASRSISLIDRAINTVSSQRAKIGSYTNALEHTMSNLTTSSTNLTDADSRLRDADISRSMMDFVRLQILNQSGTSMLSQANQLPQSVLSLIGN